MSRTIMSYVPSNSCKSFSLYKILKTFVTNFVAFKNIFEVVLEMEGDKKKVFSLVALRNEKIFVNIRMFHKNFATQSGIFVLYETFLKIFEAIKTKTSVNEMIDGKLVLVKYFALFRSYMVIVGNSSENTKMIMIKDSDIAKIEASQELILATISKYNESKIENGTKEISVNFVKDTVF